MYTLHVGSQRGAEMRKKETKKSREIILRANETVVHIYSSTRKECGKMQASDDFGVYRREKTLQ